MYTYSLAVRYAMQAAVGCLVAAAVDSGKHLLTNIDR